MIDKNSEKILGYLRRELLNRTLGKLSGVNTGRSFYEKHQLKRLAKLNENTKIIEDGILDSFGLINLRDFVERTFHITIEDEEATVKTFATVKDIMNIVEGKKSKKKK